MDLKLNFDTPQHGWLPCELRLGDRFVEFEASDVPNNPVSDLVDSLWKGIRGEASEVWWHLEPAGYYFLMEPKESELLFKLQFSPDSTIAKRRTVFEASLNLKKTLMMFWRSAKKTGSFPVSDTDWPGIGDKDMNELKLKIGELGENS
ncbi:hypothetical protein [Pleionea sediminis]|uniref:hypothetical protein n=1 Tax=Pleionea sediminis TaxID=2569479 RepID=UPI0011850661|nr:hypothetical protein [Pleionea sediminis]